MQPITFFDLETDSADPNVAKIAEAAWATFADDGRMLACASSVFQMEEIAPESTEIHGLTKEHCTFGRQFPQLYSFIAEGLFKHSILAGHNAENYDRKIIELLPLGPKIFEGKTVLDTMIDLPFSQRTTSRKLTHLCSDRNIVTPDAHGALYDCIYAAKLFFSFSREEREAAILRASTPLVNIKANALYEQRHLPKKHGFKWDGASKTWWRRVRIHDREAIKMAVGTDFTMEILPPEWKPSER